ncbi:MAG TPA: adenylate/guanylate cyclase domain-containing protein [Lacunisphaera sp.]
MVPSYPSTPPIPGQRSLAAIVFTDVVGFSARMQANEEQTLRLLKQDFEIMREACIQHEGSVLKTTGDGLLLHFMSAVQAVACALAIQRTFAERLKSRPPETPLLHRVGIHLGDVFFDKDDVMGDGVNIAARLQAEAEPGGICISQTVYHVVRNKLALQVTRLGPRELKNISQAIPIYKLLLKAQSIEDSTKAVIHHDDGSDPPLQRIVASRRTWLLMAAGLILMVVAAFGTRAWIRHQRAEARAEAEQEALNAMFDAETPASIRTLADWRRELWDKRSDALETYNFGALADDLRNPGSPVTGRPEANIRAQTLQRTQYLFDWMRAALQHYNQSYPLVVRELTGTAPKEIKVYVKADGRLYYTEGGAIRQRAWSEIRPAMMAAIVAGAIIEADPLPSREVVRGAQAFANLYYLPELPAALRQGRAQRFRR